MTIAEIMEAVKELKVMELSELVKALEEEFGVSATPVAVAGGAAAGDGAAAAEAKTDFDVVLVDAGSSKIGVIKVVREITGLGLKEAKEKVDTAPQTIKEAAPEAEANEIKEKLEAAGAKVELKSFELYRLNFKRCRVETLCISFFLICRETDRKRPSFTGAKPGRWSFCVFIPFWGAASRCICASRAASRGR